MMVSLNTIIKKTQSETKHFRVSFVFQHLVVLQQDQTEVEL